MRFLLKVKACLLIIASAHKFLEFQKAKDLTHGAPMASGDDTAHKVHNAFWKSLMIVVLSGIAGALIGAIAGYVSGAASSRFISVIQVIGALLLLWGTLFVRGWQIQTFKGTTLIELVNQWIYRSLYCLGTAILVASLVWPQR